ncbi:MAG: hypothetical protein LIP28_09780 [Deltaproteobacteria bacterium]|nr:hypothetical protein [Deltaproteobacteria bacterium]
MMRVLMDRGAALVLLAALVAASSGCAWAGKAAGKAQAKVENKIEAMDKSYHDSYEQERARGRQDPDGKTEPSQNQ